MPYVFIMGLVVK